MNPSDEQKGTKVPDAGGVSSAETSADPLSAPSAAHVEPVSSPVSSPASAPSTVTEVALRSRRPGGGGKKPPPPPPGGDGDDTDDDGMLRMSFMDHLEELRSRIIKALGGIAVAFVGSIFFTKPLWNIIKAPATEALKALGYPPHLVAIDPMEQFNIIWFKLPVVCAIFIASPWVFYQIWAFIAPGLYRRERRWAAPFVLSSAGLFIMGGCFAYFVAFRFGLTFLLGIGQGDMDVVPMISITHYFDLFVDVMLGIGVVFELPVLVFLLILLKILTPSFLMAHSRYAILGIFIIAAIVTPTPDVFNMMLFALPMCVLFYVGVFAGYLLVLHRENRRFPWKKAMTIVIPVLLILALVLYLAITKFGVKLVPHAPFITR
jgi:sec-independent protein translocase protein TatC